MDDPLARTPESSATAVYARVSSEEQRENQTIKTQVEAARKWVELQGLIGGPMQVHEFYLDDGVSGTIPLLERPGGMKLVEDARDGKFSTVLVYKIDRLGRDPRDILNSTHQLDQLGVAVRSLTEEFDMSSPSGRFMFNVFAASAGFARDTQIERSISGTNYWAKEGVWLGGIVPYGYIVEGRKKNARLLVSNSPLAGLLLSEADVVRLIYRLLREEKWSCIRIAEHLNALSVPPSYAKDGRQTSKTDPDGKRKHSTAAVWRPGRVRNLVVNSVYKGEHVYGKRSKKPRELISRAVPAIVEATDWDTAQRVLRSNQIMSARNSKRRHLLRGLVRCDRCGLTFQGSDVTRPSGKREAYYRCGGKSPFRGRLQGKCPSKHIPALPLEDAVWADILGFVREPGPIVKGGEIMYHLGGRALRCGV